MADPNLERLASVLVGYSTSIQPGELVAIEGTVVALPLITEVYRQVLAAGAHPRPRVRLGRELEIFYEEASDEQLDWADPPFVALNEHADARIIIEAETNTKALSNVSPARQARRSRAREASRNRYLERAALGELKWVLTAFPTEAAAQDAEMSLVEYERFLYGAGKLFDEDPVASWESFAGRVRAAKAFLDGVRELRIVAEGTDLTLSVEGRTWEASAGKENFPDGEVFTAPLETKVDGTIRFTYPAVFQGREVNDVELRFEAGEVAGSSASHGLDFLREMIALDDGARRLGEFAFGLNDGIDRFTRNILLDEKIGGTVHLALGTAYPETGGLNRSGLHWDIICDLRTGSEVYADGELVYRDGAFLPGIL